MKAALMTRWRDPLVLTDVPDPDCPADGVIVRLEACGVCRSDHHAWDGADPDVTLPHVMGHELSGIVAAVGPDCARHAVGDRVTAPFILGCGTCADCTAGQPTVCDSQAVIGFTQWGAFAEAVAVPRADFNLVPLPEAVPFDIAAGMGCRVTTAWRALTDRGALAKGEWLAVHGCGGVGLSAVMIAKALGAKVVAVDISDAALGMAGDLGADLCVSAAEGDVAARVRALTGGGAHVSVDALGITATFDASLRSLRKLGRHVQIGMPVGAHETVPLPLLELVYARQLTLHGTRGMGAAGFDRLLDLYAQGALPLDRLITARIPLSQAGRALAAMDAAQPPGITLITDFTS
ncbi:zinc-dependent alcohol dehydrogenase family protein [Pseudaestuariivita atlantica]|uniref:Alcohol dehydrogenase n=1 Tax=Pseudaestuariivita atlantica TaxID=1317121 RepID=A0A0L1JT06_9RHOB|nr:zinc-dependent alcohol dehydrogenase family protein [Pseudaestuariivita atlantica]KNG94880.1 alcohol dehydrogenase [Pseudaestuariivita atlantica]